jgi:SAM-dependent methyltransferase
MTFNGDYISSNLDSWNKRTEAHWQSAFYDVDGFIKGKDSLNDIERNLLGDVQGKKILHLQCHFGQDTLSLGRYGAEVTGVDLSDMAIARANELSGLTKIPARFISCDLYNLPAHLDDTFDMVFTSYGTIGWLPDLDKWASIIHRYLKPGGRFVFAEFHPVVWMFDNDFKTVQYDYFKKDPIVEIETGTYANRDASITHQSVTWNHSLSEVIGSLLQQGLSITHFNEYDYSPYNCFNETEEFAPGKFRIRHFENRIPMVYSICAMKKQGI